VAAFARLLSTATHLQGPKGCAWDRAQTPATILPYAIEELWEAFHAVRSRRRAALNEELGDALYSLIFLALILERTRRGRLAEVFDEVNRKMVRRHPHVFKGVRAPTARAAYGQWEAIKRREAKRSPSPSREFRQTLVAVWDWLQAAPEPRAKRLLALLKHEERAG
jgi:uncharacterized protein YabN with tetrapyrrole methylase and pyrophosphatase domain